ncbi:GntR family transcriptional regulator [Breoghania corrubedonensis]|uniref:GntR family transcriptional regulator n=1 Tax=Breoghania corrubedonensis TaxID=665038 RepID=A0A2T5VBF2_9HYPH|nr:PLP-dependent aminotransferase family protein [Breoghania corrubedonensis]PTW61074.1 GntR family transcriptional regulator [Breoghania corrubedonensis]
MMIEHYFDAPFSPDKRLQQQIQERLVEAILAGGVSAHEPLPSTRSMAERIKVSRNTVSLVYERLAEDGYLKPVSRRGYFVDERYVREQLSIRVDDHAHNALGGQRRAVDFARRMKVRLCDQPNITKPANWHEFEYPFVYGQIRPDRISINRWRDAVRVAGTAEHAPFWMSDLVDNDDPMLVEQIIRRTLPQRGFRAGPENILVTIGAQNALYLIASLLSDKGTRVGVEEPGYVDARNIFLARGCTLAPQPVDANGMRVTEALAGTDLVYVTPGHHSPTNVTMGLQRRLALLEAADRHDFLVIEDDYEHELNFVGAARPALKSFDQSGRVIHVGSLSKPVFPGLRLGFIAAAEPLLRELRALRRLMCRHVSALDQRAMAIFLADGHYDAHIRRQRESLAAKWKCMLREIGRQLPECDVTMTTGGSALWLSLPRGVDARQVAERAAQRGVLVEPGDVHYASSNAPLNRLRLGFAAIAQEKIAPGLQALGEVMRDVQG